MKRCLVIFLSIALLSLPSLAQTKEARDKLEKARRELTTPRPNFERVEKQIKEALKASPDYLDAQQALGELYYAERRFDAAAEEFKKAKALDDQQKKLSREARDAMLDQFGLSQAQARKFEDAIATYKSALAEHAEYAPFEYNLACSYAEKGDLDSALPHLKKSWELRDTMPRGQGFPDPRKDDSFKRFWNDERFQKAVENIVV